MLLRFNALVLTVFYLSFYDNNYEMKLSDWCVKRRKDI